MRPDLVAHPKGGWYRPDDPGDPTQSCGPAYSVDETDLETLRRYAARQKVLEIGTGCGVSANAMAEVAESVTTIGVREWERDNIWPLLSDNVTPTMNRATAWDGRYFDVVFIDGDHAEDAVVLDIAFALAVVRDGGWILLHDAAYDPIKEAARRCQLTGVYHPSSAGILACRVSL